MERNGTPAKIRILTMDELVEIITAEVLEDQCSAMSREVDALMNGTTLDWHEC